MEIGSYKNPLEFTLACIETICAMWDVMALPPRDNTDKWTKPAACLGRAWDGEEIEGETEREGGSNRTVGPSSPFYFPLSFFFLSCPSIFFTLVKLPELKCGNLETQRVYSKTKHPIIATGTGGSDLSTSGITDGCNSSQEPNSASLQAKKNLHLVTKTNYSWSECRKTQHFTKMNKSRAATYVVFFYHWKLVKLVPLKWNNILKKLAFFVSQIWSWIFNLMAENIFN